MRFIHKENSSLYRGTRKGGQGHCIATLTMTQLLHEFDNDYENIMKHMSKQQAEQYFKVINIRVVNMEHNIIIMDLDIKGMGLLQKDYLLDYITKYAKLYCIAQIILSRIKSMIVPCHFGAH
jgi:hypothetical protein